MDRIVFFRSDLFSAPTITPTRDENDGREHIECSLVGEEEGKGLYRAEGRGYIWLMPHPDAPGGGKYYPASCWMAADPRQPQPVGWSDDASSSPQLTYQQALREGYKPAGTALQRGYVSPQANPDDQPVRIAGGTRHGQLYVLLSNPRSNRYCIRQYLRREEV